MGRTNQLLAVFSFGLLVYTIYFGFISSVPARHILNESIRNLYFHVPMWFTMFVLLSFGLYYALLFLIKKEYTLDAKAIAFNETAMVFGVLGLLTGMLWAKYTWGSWWVSDPKLNGSAITLLMYGAYFLLRSSIRDERLKARLSNVYVVFCYVMWIVFLIVLPRMTDSLHPGNGGNPGFNSYDLDHSMRLVFYPAVIGWICFGLWISNVRFKLSQTYA